MASFQKSLLKMERCGDFIIPSGVDLVYTEMEGDDILATLEKEYLYYNDQTNARRK